MRGLVPLDNKIARMTVSFSNSAEFVDRHMIGLVTLDEVLRFVSRSVVHIAFDPDIRNNFLHNVMTPRTLPASEFHSTWSPRINILGIAFVSTARNHTQRFLV